LVGSSYYLSVITLEECFIRILLGLDTLNEILYFSYTLVDWITSFKDVERFEETWVMKKLALHIRLENGN
jgi:hypothetical protein